MKYLYYLLIIGALYLVLCAFNAVMHLHPFAALFDAILAGICYYSAQKYKQ